VSELWEWVFPFHSLSAEPVSIWNRGLESQKEASTRTTCKETQVLNVWVYSTIVRGREQSDQESDTHGKISVAIWHKRALMTSNSECRVASTSEKICAIWLLPSRGSQSYFSNKKTQKAWFVSIKTKGRYWIGRRTFCLLICVSSVLIGSQETSPGPAVSVGLFYCRIYRLALLSYLIFDFVCLTLSFADTHGITKYARTYIQRYTHTRTHKKKKKKGEKKKKKM